MRARARLHSRFDPHAAQERVAFEPRIGKIVWLERTEFARRFEGAQHGAADRVNVVGNEFGYKALFVALAPTRDAPNQRSIGLIHLLESRLGLDHVRTVESDARAFADNDLAA